MVSTRSSQSSSKAASPSSAATASGTHGAWSHAPTAATLAWLAVSLPLVLWDCGYVLGRPHTMEGGWLHEPLYAPYRLYGEVDHVYGWKSWNAHNGFTAAQGVLNLVETALYLAYVYVYYAQRQPVHFAGSGPAGVKRVLTGRPAALAVLLAFSAAVMTLSKTVLYWANEYFSGFDNIGHNSLEDLIPLWIIPNGLWLVLPTYMIYSIGGDIIDGLTTASAGVANLKSE